MSYNGSGTFQINSAGQPVVTGTVISSTAFNAFTADIATGLSTAICKDGQTTVTGNITLSNNRLVSVSAGVNAGDAVIMSQLQTNTASTLSAVAGTNTVTATATPTPSAYASGQQFSFIPANTNTGATTINISSLGAKNLFWNGAACVGGEIRASIPVQIKYDGTQFNIMGNGFNAPFLDTHAVVEGSADSTKKIRFEVDDLTTATTRTVTAQDVSGIMALMSTLIFSSGVTVNYSGAMTTNNTLVFTLRNRAGSAPTSSFPVEAYFDNAGSITKCELTTTNTIVVPSGATLGTENAIPSRVYFGLLNNAGTAELCCWNPVTLQASVSGSSDYRDVTALLRVTPSGTYDTTTIGTGADSAGVIYSSTGRTGVHIIPIARFDSTQTVAGVWAQSGTLTILGPGDAITGEVLQAKETRSGALGTGTTVVPMDDTIPASGTEGDLYMSAAQITTQWRQNIIELVHVGNYANSAATDGLAVFATDGTGGVTLAVQAGNVVAAGDQQNLTLATRLCKFSANTFDGRIYAGGSAAGTTTFNGRAGGRLYGGTMGSHVVVREICA